jgi:hypothetical protein
VPTGRFLPIDGISGNQLVLEPEHGAIHGGTHYVATLYDADLDSSSMSVMITTPVNSTYIHFIADVEANNSGVWTFSEAPNATGGTAMVSYNNKRTETTASPATITSNPTITSVGTVLDRFIIGADGPGSNGSGGAVGHRNEWLLAPETKYLVQFTADNDNTKVVIRMPYYYRAAIS